MGGHCTLWSRCWPSFRVESTGTSSCLLDDAKLDQAALVFVSSSGPKFSKTLLLPQLVNPRNASFLYFIQDSTRTYYQCIREHMLMYNLDIKCQKASQRCIKKQIPNLTKQRTLEDNVLTVLQQPCLYQPNICLQNQTKLITGQIHHYIYPLFTIHKFDKQRCQISSFWFVK